MGEIKRVPFSAAESEFTEKRSRFIGHLWPICSEEEARCRIQEMKKQYYDARHNCWCYLLGDNVLRYSDDGEPQGTAGQPMLHVFQQEHISDVCCVVTRYFGGILLGAGGLTRAYSRSARDTLAVAGVADVELWAQAELPCSYPLLERVKLEIAAIDGIINDVAYGADILLRVSLPLSGVEQLQKRLTEISAGSMFLTVTGQVSRAGNRKEL